MCAECLHVSSFCYVLDPSPPPWRLLSTKCETQPRLQVCVCAVVRAISWISSLLASRVCVCVCVCVQLVEEGRLAMREPIAEAETRGADDTVVASATASGATRQPVVEAEVRGVPIKWLMAAYRLASEA